MNKLRKRLTLRYSTALSLIALLFIGSYFLVSELIEEQFYDARIVSVAARQQTLVQKTTQELQYLTDSSHLDHWQQHYQGFKEASSLFWKSHQNLNGTSRSLGFIPVRSEGIDSLMANIHPYASRIHQNALALKEELDAIPKGGKLVIKNTGTLEELNTTADKILPYIDALTFSYEAESQRHIRRISQAQFFILLAGFVIIVISIIGIFKPMVDKVVQERENMIRANEELSASEEELRQQQEEMASQREVIEASNKRLEENQALMQKFIEKLKSREEDLKEKNEELLTSEEELRQQQEEILAQREAVEESNRKLQENQALMQKFIERLKSREEDLKEKNEELLTSEEELRQQQEEILAQREAVEQKSTLLESANQQLQENEKLMVDFIEKLRSREKELEEKNNFIELSIRSAEQIQASILPSKEYRKQLLPQHCLFYLPKDIVSGDFFWLSNHGDQVLVGVIDCTGHGISGAFISLLGYSILRQVIYQQQCINPAQVLVELNKGISEYLRENEYDSNYGMDAGFCLMDKEEAARRKVVFAGAKSKLFYTHNKKINFLKGDRTSLGGVYTKRASKFTAQELVLDKGETIYLSTDGYSDQANNAKRKIGKHGFIGLLESLQDKPMEAQELELMYHFHEYREDTTQRDDVTVLGIKI